MKKRKPEKPLRQTMLDEFTGGDMLVGAQAGGGTIRPDPVQDELFQKKAQQLRFEVEEKNGRPTAR